MIYVEGMDNSGKTTLVKHLASTFGLPVVVSCFDHRKNYNERMYDVHCRVLRLLASGVGFVADRATLISEHVYGPPLRGVNDVTGQSPVKEDQMWSVWLSYNPLIIYCRPADHEIFNFGDREQMEGVVERSEMLLDRYDHLMADLEHNREAQVFHYNYEKPEQLEQVEKLVRTHLCI